MKKLYTKTMTTKNPLQEINNKLIEILSQDSGYFGMVKTWGQRPRMHEYIGYELTEDFYPVLEKLSEKQRKTLVGVMNYFYIHAHPLKDMLKPEKEEDLYTFFAKISWSHFMTVVMFGMLELVVKNETGVKLSKNGSLLDKGSKIKEFLERNLSDDIKKDVTERYSFRISSEKKGKCPDFSSVIDHMWQDIRCGFIHEAGIESKGLEWSSFSGVGTKKNPITIERDVPMPEWLQLTWQSIFNSYGYKGKLILPKYKK